MSYREKLVSFFKSQALGAPESSAGSVKKFSPVTLENFLYFQLSLYPGYKGRDPTSGDIKSIESKLSLSVRPTKSFTEILNESAEAGSISLSGINLSDELKGLLLIDAHQCRTELLKNKKSALPGIVDLRITRNSINRLVLTTSLEAGHDEDHLDTSPLLVKLNREIVN